MPNRTASSRSPRKQAATRKAATKRAPARPPAETEAGSGAALGIRARARAEMLDQIKSIARTHLAAEGTALSLRAVARDLGVVSSAVYRYFDSREALLAALADDARASLTDTVTAAEAKVTRRDLAGRWVALARSLRGWAVEHPHEFGLLFGVPVGPAVPADGEHHAAGPLAVVAAILGDGVSRGSVTASDRLARSVRADLERAAGDVNVPAGVLARGATAWTQLVGAVGLELSQRSAIVTEDADAWFDHQVRAMSAYLGLTSR